MYGSYISIQIWDDVELFQLGVLPHRLGVLPHMPQQQTAYAAVALFGAVRLQLDVAVHYHSEAVQRRASCNLPGHRFADHSCTCPICATSQSNTQCR